MSNALSVVNADPRLKEASFSFKMMFRFAKTAVATRARNVQDVASHVVKDTFLRSRKCGTTHALCVVAVARHWAGDLSLVKTNPIANLLVQTNKPGL